MRTITLSSVLGALLALSSSAQATGLNTPAFDWTGLYFGAHVGGAQTDIAVRDLDSYNFDGNFSHDADGWFAGGQIGINRQSGAIVYGLEAELGFLDLDGSRQFPPYVGVRSPRDSVASLEGDIYGTIAGRLGVTFGRFLAYGKVGWGAAEVEASFIDRDPIGTILTSGTHDSETVDGIVYGGGLELAVSPNVSLKAEYLRLDFGDDLRHTAQSISGGAFRFVHDFDEIETVKVGVNIKFGALHQEAMVAEPLK